MEIINYIITFLLVIIDVLITAHLYYIWKAIEILNDKINQENNQDSKINKTFKRNHSKINPVSFSNPIQARKNMYKEYENDKGLYEPISPRKGIKIKEDK